MPMPRQKPGRSKQDYQTPPEFVAAVKRLLDITEFDCDLAATAENSVAGDWFYDEAVDALAQGWKVNCGWNWLNPPFGDIEPWVQKAYEQAILGAQTAVLVPASVGANWWRDWVDGKADVLFLNGRLTFLMCDGPYPKDCALLLYPPPRLSGAAKYSVWNWREMVDA